MVVEAQRDGKKWQEDGQDEDSLQDGLAALRWWAVLAC